MTNKTRKKSCLDRCTYLPDIYYKLDKTEKIKLKGK